MSGPTSTNEIRPNATGTSSLKKRWAPVPFKHRSIWLIVVPATFALLVWATTCWHVPTRIAVNDLMTSRVTFVVRGDQTVAPLNPAVKFSALTIERCGSVSFRAAEFEDESAHKMHAALTSLPDRIRLLCYDPDAKVSLWGVADDLESRVSRTEIGILDGVRFRPGTRVMLEVRRTPVHAKEVLEPEPVVTLGVSTSQEVIVSMKCEEFLITAEFVTIKPLTLGTALPLAVYRVRRDSAFETLTVSGDERGSVLIITPTKDSADSLFDSDAYIPVESLQFVDEKLGGGVRPATKSWTLAYPEFPEMKPKEAKDGGQFLLLSQMTDTDVRLRLSRDLSGLAVTVEGTLDKGVTGRPDAATVDQRGGRWEDLQLTMAETLVHGPRWRLVASALGSLFVSACAWLGAFKLWNEVFPKRPQ